MPAEVILRNLSRKYVEDQLVKCGVDHLVEIEAHPQGLLVRVAATARAVPGAAVAMPGAPPIPRKVVTTAITDGDLASAEREAGKAIRFGTRHTLIVEVPEGYAEDQITAARIAADPAISIVARVAPPSASLPESEPEAASAVSTTPAPVVLEPVAEKPATRIVHTAIIDEHGYALTVEVPEGFDGELTAESIASDSAVTIVSRVRPADIATPIDAPISADIATPIDAPISAGADALGGTDPNDVDDPGDEIPIDLTAVEPAVRDEGHDHE